MIGNIRRGSLILQPHGGMAARDFDKNPDNYGPLLVVSLAKRCSYLERRVVSQLRWDMTLASLGFASKIHGGMAAAVSAFGRWTAMIADSR